MTPEYLSTEDAAIFCHAPNAKAFRQRMYRAGIRAGKWGSWKVDVLRALMEKSRRCNRSFKAQASRFQHARGPFHAAHLASKDVADLHAADGGAIDAAAHLNSLAGQS